MPPYGNGNPAALSVWRQLNEQVGPGDSCRRAGRQLRTVLKLEHASPAPLLLARKGGDGNEEYLVAARRI